MTGRRAGQARAPDPEEGVKAFRRGRRPIHYADRGGRDWDRGGGRKGKGTGYEGWRKGDTDKDRRRERGDWRLGRITVKGERTGKREERKLG